MSLLPYGRKEMLKDYTSCCRQSAHYQDLLEQWPPICAKVRDPATHNNYRFTLTRQQVTRIRIANSVFNWANAEAGEAMALLMRISDVDCISACDNRLAFLKQGQKRFSLLCEREMEFITDFISTWVWLTPKNGFANNGNASFYQIPHVTFISDATLFFIPPFHQIPRQFGFLGFVENLYHEALHHQIHTFLAFHGQKYCYGNLAESLIQFPQRQDRTFSYSQAFNACYVYGEIVKYRQKVANVLKEGYRPVDSAWITEALSSAIMMRSNLIERLYCIKEAFLPPWKLLIEAWKFENKPVVDLTKGNCDE